MQPLAQLTSLSLLPGALLTALKIMRAEQGDVLHAIKHSDPGFNGFEEVYFSTVHHKAIKGWKRHHKMTLNLVVPAGEIRFVLFDERPQSATHLKCAEITLSPQNYQRLTVPPGVWLSFCGVGPDLNLLMNCANLVHDPAEAENRALDHTSMPKVWDNLY